ncbi:MAG TPA: hypothetical protein VFC78_12165 [Tepidisphaeraceae bacterium]|nr:hypothetical protein [Tepidisphaeraceae bacterium]
MPYLEITYRQGKPPFAAYLYLNRRSGDKAARTVSHEGWLADFTQDGRAIGVEFTQVTSIDVAALNRVLADGHQSAITVEDLRPLV